MKFLKDLSPKKLAILVGAVLVVCAVVAYALMPKCETSCPDGWEGDGNFCRAPPEYTGPCNRTAKLTGYDRNRRKEWGADCQLTFSACA